MRSILKRTLLYGLLAGLTLTVCAQSSSKHWRSGLAGIKRSGVERGTRYRLDRCHMIGPETAAWSEGFFAHRGIYALRALQGLVGLTKQHPVAAIEHAAAAARRSGAWRLRDLRRLLTDDDKVVQIDFLEAHPLIRPLDAYSLEALSQT